MMGMTDLSCLDLEHVCRQALPPALQMKNLFGTESFCVSRVQKCLPHALAEPPEPPIKEGVRVFGTNIEGREQSTALTFFS